MNRRKFLKYCISALFGIALSGIGDYAYKKYFKKPSITLSPTQIAETISVTSPTLTPLASYAKSKGLSQAVIERLGSRLGDRLTDNNKALVDYLCNLSQVEVVSPEVLKFTSEHYKPSVVESLQLKAIDNVVEENKVSDQAVVALGYLSTFPGPTQRWYIEQHGLDASAIDLLTRAKGLVNQDFAKYAVESLVCIQDHNPLTSAEIAFLENPGNKFKDLRDDYLADMESRGNPYDDFAKDWRKMIERTGVGKEIESLDATEDWVYLVLNADNPEVKEAEELKLKGGTPDPKDFTYTVPNYNTEQLVQYWLGKQNEFKRNDTLAQAIAMVNGLWVTTGDEQVRKAVYKDTNDLLNFFRETDEIQKAREYYQLEDYPLEAKVCLVWSGSQAIYMNWARHSISGVDRPGKRGGEIKADIKDYEWDTVSVQTLREMRQFMGKIGWFVDDAERVNELIERYFYIDSAHWDNPTDPNNVGGLREDVKIIIDGEEHLPRNFWNVDFMWAYFKRTGRGIGVCADNSAFVDALNKAIGISTAGNGVQWIKDHEPGGHGFVTFFIPHLQCWKSHPAHLRIRSPQGWLEDEQIVYLQLFIPPWKQDNYLIWKYEPGIGFYNTKAFYSPQMDLFSVRRLLSEGISTATMKQWLFYS